MSPFNSVTPAKSKSRPVQSSSLLGPQRTKYKRMSDAHIAETSAGAVVSPVLHGVSVSFVVPGKSSSSAAGNDHAQKVIMGHVEFPVLNLLLYEARWKMNSCQLSSVYSSVFF